MHNRPPFARRRRHLLLAVALSFAYLHSTQSAEYAGVFKVGVVASATGQFAEWSDAMNGYRLWEQALTAAGGFPLRADADTIYRYGVKLIMYDDNSTAEGHAAAIDTLVRGDAAHFILGASPVFAESESIMVHRAGRLNFHCCTGASGIFARDQKNVFGMSVDHALFTQELFTEFRSSNVYMIAVIYRNDVLELQSACQGVLAQAKTQLLTITLELPYSNSSTSTLNSLADKLAASAAEAIIMCGLQSENSLMAQLIDNRRKPLKAIVFSSGAYTRAWNERLGNMSTGILSFAHWAPDLTSRKDNFWGDSASYSGKYKSAFGQDAGYMAAAASATGYVLQTVLNDVFRSCNLSAEALADPAVLLFKSGAISCTDNNNHGHSRLVTTLALVNMDTVYGVVAFDRFRQNRGYTPATLQTYEVSENLKLSYKPSLVLPLATATRPLLLPLPNRYAPTCQPGTYRGPDDFANCIPCGPGEFQEFPGRTNCELCPKDTYANTTSTPDCHHCPPNTLTLQRGSTKLTDCLCMSNFFNKAGRPGLPCEPCPSGAVCVGGTSPPSPLYGFYAEVSAPYAMYRCNPSRVCTGNFTCMDGYRGRMCHYCDEGYYRFLGNCVRCPSRASNVVGYLIVLALLWITINIWFARSVENLMVVINFCQLLSIVVGFSLNWPANLYQVMSFSSIFSFEMDSMEPSCLVRTWDFNFNLVVQLLLPLIIAVLVGIWCLMTYVICIIKQKRISCSLKDAASLKMAMQAPWKQMLWDLMDVPVDKRELREMFMERASIPLNFLNIGFLVLFKYSLSVFQCTEINGVSYLAASPNLKCFTPKHWNLIWLGSAGLVIYSLGFIFMYGHVVRLLGRQRALGDKTSLLLYGWMYERYEAQYYWYEIVTVAQRAGFVLVALFIQDPALQALLAMLISIAVLLMDIYSSAYVDKTIHLLQAAADGVLGAVLVSGLLFYNPLSDEAVIHAVQVILLCTVLGAFASALLLVLYAIAVRFAIAWLLSKHRPIAHKMGLRVKGFRHMYQVFGPLFLFQWLRRCSQEEWEDWHRLCMVLIDYVHPTSEVSYLSLKKVGRFWRYLLANFPETIDYLVSVKEEQRKDFNNFIDTLYDSFFDTKDEHRHQVYYYVTDKFKAAFAQWLSSCDDDDRIFCQHVMKTALGKAKGVQAATELSAAMSRANTIVNAATVLTAIERFKKKRHFAQCLRQVVGGGSVRLHKSDVEGGSPGLASTVDGTDTPAGASPKGGSPCSSTIGLTYDSRRLLQPLGASPSPASSPVTTPGGIALNVVAAMAGKTALSGGARKTALAAALSAAAAALKAGDTVPPPRSPQINKLGHDSASTPQLAASGGDTAVSVLAAAANLNEAPGLPAAETDQSSMVPVSCATGDEIPNGPASSSPVVALVASPDEMARMASPPAPETAKMPSGPIIRPLAPSLSDFWRMSNNTAYEDVQTLATQADTATCASSNPSGVTATADIVEQPYRCMTASSVPQAETLGPSRCIITAKTIIPTYETAGSRISSFTAFPDDVEEMSLAEGDLLATEKDSGTAFLETPLLPPPPPLVLRGDSAEIPRDVDAPRLAPSGAVPSYPMLIPVSRASRTATTGSLTGGPSNQCN